MCPVKRDSSDCPWRRPLLLDTDIDGDGIVQPASDVMLTY